MDAATIEETNRIRLSLGMKPLPVPGAQPSQQVQLSDESDGDGEAASTLETRQAQAYDNYKEHLEAEAARKRREAKAAAVRKAREAAQRFALLDGKGLGDDKKGEDLDAKSWLTGQKKRQKKIEKARKLEEELAAAEAAAAAAVRYTSKDLAGIKVAHDSSAFLEGNEQILTLKDTTIDQNEEEGDELENVDLREGERLTERLDLKKRRPGYDPNDEDEGERGILAQYDEEINGKRSKKFTLDADGAIAELSDILGDSAPKASKIQSVSLDDIIGDAPISSDYLAPSEIKIKKPKKKKSKGTRQKPPDDDDIFPLEPAQVDANAMELDGTDNVRMKRKMDEDAFIDDDDLQASLSIQRKQALKKRKKISPEDIAKQLKEQGEEPERPETGQNEGLVIGEISEFVAGLSKNDEDEKPKVKRQKTVEINRDEPLDEYRSYRDQIMDDAGELGGAKTSNSEGEIDGNGVEDKPIEEEKSVGHGMGSALALLRERGLIAESKGEETHESQRARQEFLRQKKLLEEELEEKARQQRERDRTSGRLDRMSRADREEYARQQNQSRDQQHARRIAELISSSYRPAVNIKYVDEHGRPLDIKEAFKHLSHQFHGKGSGKGKTEKKLKQIEDEKRRESQSLFDANQGGGMSAATTQQLKKRKEAGVRLG
ncbi:hypothetical protein HIM_00260 [Hirsutella minnesotensis 3608]|nr:hypothetical protein HIM_00260 [Hirsutella minnesotensis 3608]